MRAAKRQGGFSASDSKKTRRDGGDETEDVFFERDVEGSASDDVVEETPEEKKLALAKAYLAKVGAEIDASDDEHSPSKTSLQGFQYRSQRSSPTPASTQLPSRPAFLSSGIYGVSRWEPTRLAVPPDCRTIYLVDKNGGVALYDTETGSKIKIPFERDFAKLSQSESTKAPWVSRTGSYGIAKRALIAAAISDDQKLLAVGGGDKHIHIFDTTSNTCIHSFSGHREAVSGLVFQSGSHNLFSCSYDRTIKVWSVEDFGYVDTLYGHQSEVFDIDALHHPKLLTVGNDRSCRIWKTQTDSQLVFRAPSLSVDCGRLLDGTSFVTGSSAGLQLWSASKKKPISGVQLPHSTSNEKGWVQSLGIALGSDLIASGAGDGVIRLWQADRDTQGRFASLKGLGAGLAARGCVTFVHVRSSGDLVISAVSRRPRLGQWGADTTARQGVYIHRLGMSD